MKNKYEIEGNVLKLYLNGNNGETFISLFDVEDLPKLQVFDGQFCVTYSKFTQSYYCVITIHNKISEVPVCWTASAHKIILQYYGSKFEVDHINHNTLDNRKENLRFVGKSDNAKNRKGKNINNKSGYRNVAVIDGKYVVQLMINGRNTVLGRFKDVDKAGAFAEKMRQKYYGEFAGKS